MHSCFYSGGEAASDNHNVTPTYLVNKDNILDSLSNDNREKMSMQQFCLRWNNHQPNFISVFSNLLHNETLTDVTLAAEGRHLQAHKVVLSACSSYFQSLFTVNPCQHPIVILKDVKFSDLKIMVDFMYYGEVNVSQDQLPSIIKTAESLKIKGLAEMHTASFSKWPSESRVERGESCSPSSSPHSPSYRRKRLRKSSTGSNSGDKSEEISEITLVATNIVKPEPAIMSQDAAAEARRLTKTAAESQENIDEDQISIMSNMESSSTATPVQSETSIQDLNQQPGSNMSQSSVTSQPSAHQASSTQVKPMPRLRQLLNEDSTGREILKMYEKIKKVDRSKLATVIIRKETEHDPDTRIRSDRFNYWAQEIVTLFPNEVKETYYIPYSRGPDGPLSARGILWSKYTNRRRSLRGQGLLEKKRMRLKKNPLELPSGSCDDEYQVQSVEWLQNNIGPREEVFQKWAATSRLRLSRIENTSIEAYYNMYKCLQQNYGHFLVDIDFRFLHGNICDRFPLIWPQISAKLIDYGMKQTSVEVRHFLTMYNTEIEEGNIEILALILLPLLMKTMPLKSKTCGEPHFRPTRDQVQRNFIVHVSDIRYIRAALDERKKFLMDYKLCDQPVPLFVGSMQEIKSSFVIVNNVEYMLESPLKAVETCFKLFFALNAEYPTVCEHVWIFLEKFVFQMRRSHAPNYVTANSLASELGLQWTIMEHTYPRFALSSCQTNLSIQSPSGLTTPEIGVTSSLAEQYSTATNTGSGCPLMGYPSSPHSSMQSNLSTSNATSSTQQCPSNCNSPCTSPQQTTVKRKRSTNPQADENFIRALDAVRYGGIGFCKAARMFGVNNRTLWLEYKKRGYPNNRPSLKSRVKQESANSSTSSSPPPPPLINLTTAGTTQQQSVDSQSPTPMGPPSTTTHSAHNTHTTHTMLTTHSPHSMLSGYLDARHTDYALQSSSMPINLHGVNYSAL